MRLPAIVFGVSAVALGGFLIYDSMGPGGQRTRALHEIEVLAADSKIPPCLPPGEEARPFVAALKLDALPKNFFDTDSKRRGMIKHDCLRGAQTHATLDKVVAAGGDEATPFFAGVIARCTFNKDEYPPPACVAMDGLNGLGTPAAIAALDKVATNRQLAKELWLGALFRLANLPGGRTAEQLAALLGSETEPDVVGIVLEQLRKRKSPAAKAALEAAYAKEQDPDTKGHLKAGLLEIDNPDKCVAEDEGRGEDGICRYFCDEKLRLRFPKTGDTCALTHDRPPAPGSAPAAPAAPAPAAPAAPAPK